MGMVLKMVLGWEYPHSYGEWAGRREGTHRGQGQSVGDTGGFTLSSLSTGVWCPTASPS